MQNAVLCLAPGFVHDQVRAAMDHCHLSVADVETAASRIASLCTRTPLLESPIVNQRLGGRLLVKAENLQVTGSFKLRGACNRLAVLTTEERVRGVVARSSGNHGLAIAYCAHLLNVRATVVVPASAPRAKLDRMRSFNAEVILVDDIHKLQQVAETTAKTRGAIFVPPADDPWIVAGAGTVGLEIAQQVREIGAELDALLVCCSGGGLTAGCTLALNAKSPATDILAVEPSGFEKMAKSIAAGYRVNNEPGKHTICDALSGPYTAAIPFEIVKYRLSGTVSVTDEEVRSAMRTAFSEFGVALEPGGAVGLAAVLSNHFSIAGKTVGIIFSGRNVDPELAGSILVA